MTVVLWGGGIRRKGTTGRLQYWGGGIRRKGNTGRSLNILFTKTRKVGGRRKGGGILDPYHYSR